MTGLSNPDNQRAYGSLQSINAFGDVNAVVVVHYLKLVPIVTASAQKNRPAATSLTRGITTSSAARPKHTTANIIRIT